MKLTCSGSADELPHEGGSGVIVLPEDVPLKEILLTSARLPTSIVVGAARDGQYMRGYAMLAGVNQIDYRKKTNDGRSSPFEGSQDLPIFESERLAVGVLICIDYRDNELRLPVMEKLCLSRAKIKIICIPADMGNAFFDSQNIGAIFHGVNVALSNNQKTHQNPSRCRSFIANAEGLKLATQSNYEAIVASAA